MGNSWLTAARHKTFTGWRSTSFCLCGIVACLVKICITCASITRTTACLIILITVYITSIVFSQRRIIRGLVKGWI